MLAKFCRKQVSLASSQVRCCGSQSAKGRRRPQILKEEEVTGDTPVSKIPLNIAVPGLPKVVYARPTRTGQQTQVTTLSNGLKVASERKFGDFASLGVLIDSGSRYEVAYPSGISHFLEKLAFGDTVNLSREEIMSNFEACGGISDCQSSRDTLIYASSVESKSLDSVMKVLGEVTLRPKLTDQEIKSAAMHVKFDLETLEMRPEKDMILMEMVHTAAYRDNTLGLPKICPPQNIDLIDRNTLMTYLCHHHTPQRTVIAAVGVEHDALVEAAQKYFVDEAPIWHQDKTLCIDHSLLVDTSIAQYTGGMEKREADLSDVSIGPNPLPELSHVVVAVEGVGHKHDDFVTCCVLNMMMGGGGSFSAGGPGKGMYTRLYTNVLNRYHWMNNATAFNHSYADSGIFCIYASAHPSHLYDMVQVVVRELVRMTKTIGQEEFERAKVQLKSMLLMNLETRPVIFEDIGRQVLSTGTRRQPQYYIDLIDQVTKDDVVRVATRLIHSKPAVSALGTLKNLPPITDIEEGLLHESGQIGRRSFFSLRS